MVRVGVCRCGEWVGRFEFGRKSRVSSHENYSHASRFTRDQVPVRFMTDAACPVRRSPVQIRNCMMGIGGCRVVRRRRGIVRLKCIVNQ